MFELSLRVWATERLPSQHTVGKINRRIEFDVDVGRRTHVVGASPRVAAEPLIGAVCCSNPKRKSIRLSADRPRSDPREARGRLRAWSIRLKNSISFDLRREARYDSRQCFYRTFGRPSLFPS